MNEIVEQLVDATKEKAIQLARREEIKEWTEQLLSEVYYDLSEEEEYEEIDFEKYEKRVFQYIDLEYLDEIGRQIGPRRIEDHYKELGLSQSDFL